MLLHTFFLAVAMAQNGSLPISDIPTKMTKPAPAESAVLVKVNGVEIRASDVTPLLWQWRGSEVLQDLVNYQVVKDAAQKANVAVDEAELQTQLAAFIQQIQKSLQPGQDLQSAMQAEGSSESRLYIRLKTEMLLRKLVLKDMKPDEWVKISTLIVKPDSESSDAVTAAIKKADDAYSRLKKGENFEDVLKSVVSDPVALQSKGLIGWRHLNAFPQGVQNEFKALNSGGYTKPSQTVNGIQIFRLEKRGKDVTGDELEELKSFVATVQRQAVFNKLAETAKIERINK